jgi:hypothetical protein
VPREEVNSEEAAAAADCDEVPMAKLEQDDAPCIETQEKKPLRALPAQSQQVHLRESLLTST